MTSSINVNTIEENKMITVKITCFFLNIYSHLLLTIQQNKWLIK